MLPASSSKCLTHPSSSSFDFELSQAESKWYGPIEKFEKHVFLAKMQHIEENKNRTWTLRLGRAGNIYSLVGPMGETVPPQALDKTPWVDDVWQNVATYSASGPIDKNDPNKFFIHEAGTYQNDAPYTDVPFYSPTLGSYCDDRNGECGFISWGQQAHIPTPWTSPMLFFNRYTNCGNGTIEHTTLRHRNMGGLNIPGEPYDYFNVPWGGTRKSVLNDVVLTSTNNGHHLLYPLEQWPALLHITELRDTAGYTIFAQDLPKEQGMDHNTTYSLPNNLDLTIDGNCKSNGVIDNREIYSCPLIKQAITHYGSGLGVVRMEGNTGKSIIAGVVFFCRNNRLYFYKSASLTLTEVREALPVGSTVKVYHWSPSSGEPEEDNLALAHVHGSPRHVAGFDPRLRVGGTSYKRDKNIYTINTIQSLHLGDSYHYRSYFSMDKYTEMATTGPYWASEAHDGKYGAGDEDFLGRTVNLYSDGSSTFGFTIGEDKCSSTSASMICEGKTTPRPNYKAMFQIQCGEHYVVTDDLYYFSPDDSLIRSYACSGLGAQERPTWTLLGFFGSTECDEIKDKEETEQYMYDGNFCK